MIKIENGDIVTKYENGKRDKGERSAAEEQNMINTMIITLNESTTLMNIQMTQAMTTTGEKS